MPNPFPRFRGPNRARRIRLNSVEGAAGGSGPLPYHPDNLITRKELAKRLDCSVKSLECMQWRAEGPPVKRLGRRIRYRWGDVLDWLKSCQ